MTGQWRVLALLVGVGWVISAIAMILLAVSAYARSLSGLALAVVMVAGLPVLTLMKNLAGHIADDTEPGRAEYLLAGIGAVLIIAGWVLHLSGS